MVFRRRSALFPASRAATAGAVTGTIAGRVMNATTGTYLDKARVVVEGTSLEALTNESGDFKIVGVPAGTAKNPREPTPARRRKRRR